MKSPKNTEKGQILVLLVLVIIGLLGMTALAIDGSMLYADRRFTQSVADSSSLAGGNAIKEYFADGNITDAEIDACSDTKFINATVLALNGAITRAREYYPEIENKTLTSANIALTNDTFEIISGAINLAGHKFSVTCDIGQKSLIVNVELTSQTNTAFIQVISPVIARNTVHAETEVVANRSLTGGYALISLSQACQNNRGGTWVNGTPNITLTDGGACSNSCMRITGNSTVDSDGPLNYDIGDGYSGPGQPYVNPAPTGIDVDCIDVDPFAAIFTALETACATMGPGIEVQETSGLETHTYFQGKFQNIEQTTNEPMVFKPGLYCLTHTGNKPSLKINGGTVTGVNVTFVILDGDVNVAGNAGVTDIITLSAPQDLDSNGIVDFDPDVESGECTKTDSTVPGPQITTVQLDGSCPNGYDPVMEPNLAKAPFLFYVTDWGTNNNRPILSLLGTSASAYDGIVYAPTSLVTIGGTSAGVTATYGTSIIGYDVTIAGTSFVDLIALDEGVPSVSGWLDFLK